MFDRFLAFLRDLPSGGTGASGARQDDPRLAAAALMLHVMDADGVRQESERQTLRGLLTERYDLSLPGLEELLVAGEAAERDAVDLYAFTSVLNRHLDADAKIDFVRALWEVVYADGELHELEDNVVWRIAELIGVDRRDRIAARRDVSGASSDGE